MKPWKRWLYLVAGLAAAFVAVASAAQAIRQNSWAPVVAVAWLPAVAAAAWPGSGRRCLPAAVPRPAERPAGGDERRR